MRFSPLSGTCVLKGETSFNRLHAILHLHSTGAVGVNSEDLGNVTFEMLHFIFSYVILS